LPSQNVLDVTGLSVEFPTTRGVVHAVSDVSFSIGRGQVLGLVGESGSGKSTVAHAIIRVLPGSARYAGSVRCGDQDVLALGPAALRSFRWQRVSLVMQGAMNALNPVMTIESQVVDVIRAHSKVSKRAAAAQVPGLLELVGIDPARRRSYPHELSGGMRQRCVIAIALALQPELVVMDEPTTALDVVVQRAIMDEIDRLRAQLGFSVLLISHDLDLVAERASQLAIMYAGRIVEIGSSAEVIGRPQHPYTEALLTSTMSVDGGVHRLSELGGRPPDLIGTAPGCSFFPRCPKAEAWHETQTPQLRDVAPGHAVACHLYPALEPAR
jgi:peptide/nickel transport system ATP-binding protein